jgi:hypothetical protein
MKLLGCFGHLARAVGFQWQSRVRDESGTAFAHDKPTLSRLLHIPSHHPRPRPNSPSTGHLKPHSQSRQGRRLRDDSSKDGYAGYGS